MLVSDKWVIYLWAIIWVKGGCVHWPVCEIGVGSRNLILNFELIPLPGLFITSGCSL